RHSIPAAFHAVRQSRWRNRSSGNKRRCHGQRPTESAVRMSQDATDDLIVGSVNSPSARPTPCRSLAVAPHCRTWQHARTPPPLADAPAHWPRTPNDSACDGSKRIIEYGGSMRPVGTRLLRRILGEGRPLMKTHNLVIYHCVACGAV